MRTVFRYGLFPALMALAIGGSTWAVAAGVSRLLVLNVVTLAVFLAILALERAFAARPDWVRSDGQVWNDFGHTLFGTVLGGVIGNAIVQGAYAMYLGVRGSGAASYWPSSLPLLAQIAMVYLLADLGRYWQHWCLHHSGFLWRFHQLHHSAERMSVWKTTRSHITERIAQQLFMYTLLALLGAPEAVIFWYIMPNSLLGMFAHSNLDVSLGPVELVIMGPAAHRLHHSADLHDSMRNYGSALVVWDIVFRSFSNPLERPPPARVGIVADPTPKTFLAQILHPFVPDRV